MQINIGELVQKRMDELGMTQSELARRVGTSSQNLGKMLKRSSIDTQRLLKLSKALRFDFFQYYSLQVQPEQFSTVEDPIATYLTMHPGNNPPSLKNVIIEAVTYKKEADSLRKENDLLKEVKQLLEEKLKKSE
jgi:transcriptional regulator with XRE-family HTH domain